MSRFLALIGRLPTLLKMAVMMLRLRWSRGKADPNQQGRTPAEMALVNSIPIGATTIGEISRSTDALRECCATHRGFCGMDLDAAFEWFDSAVGDCDGRRQTGLELPTGASWSVEMVQAIQTEMLPKFKNWSVAVVHPLAERSVVIHRNQVLTDLDNKPVGDLPTFLAENARSQNQWYQRERAWKDRQRTVLQKLIPQPLPILKDEQPFHLIAVFDRSLVPKYWCVYYLVDSNCFGISLTVPGQQPRGGGSAYLMADGVLFPRSNYFKNGIKHEVEAHFRLECDLIPAGYEGAILEVQQTDEEQSLFRNWTIQFDPTRVIRDDDLLRRATSS